jgi:lycopene beta-cyclase
MTVPSPALDADLILVGGGLANGLLAYRLQAQRPDLRLLVLESGRELGGDHTWSFHETDLTAAQHEWLKPFVAHEWPEVSVRFENFSRRLGIGYRSVTSERFRYVLARALGDAVRLGTAVDVVEPAQVRLRSGATLRAGAVIDGRGFRPSPHLALRYQKFLGLELQLSGPHGLAGPIIMDATVAQTDGYRFVYVLPFAEDRVLIEDTYYADRADLDREVLRRRIHAYAADRGWTAAATIREESGVLPIALDGDIEAFWNTVPGQPRAGLRAGLFHATTGYSLPDAVRLADRIAALPDLGAGPLAAAIWAHVADHWRGQRFFRLLNRMLFLAGRPEDRHRVLRRFYGFPESLIARFYAGRLSAVDKARIVAGRPPVPLGAALRALAAPDLAKG